MIYAMNVYLVRSEDQRKYFTNILLAFAMGGLLGDVFFHTLPHLAEESHDHSHAHVEIAQGGHAPHSEEAMKLNLVIVMGIWCFFLLEKITAQFLDDGHGHSHGHAHVESVETPTAPKKEDKKPKGKKVAEKVDIDKLLPTPVDAEQEKRFKSFAVISIVGDFIHNFTDGLSIGVSFVADFKMGMVTTMAMFFHEIPHEVGDFAILF